jgi:hypothetical protein
MNNLRLEHGIDPDAIVYLVGDHSYYKENLPTVGAVLSNFYRRSKHGRQKAYRLVWKLLTGYDYFHEGKNDTRWIGSNGVTMQRGGDEEDQIAYDEKSVFGSIMT